MHEKLVLVDGELLWSGSLNVLSSAEHRRGGGKACQRCSCSTTVHDGVLGLNALAGRTPSAQELPPSCNGERSPPSRATRILLLALPGPDCYTPSSATDRRDDGSNRAMPVVVEPKSVRCLRVRTGAAPSQPPPPTLITSHLRLPRMRELIPRIQPRAGRSELAAGGRDEQLRYAERVSLRVLRLAWGTFRGFDYRRLHRHFSRTEHGRWWCGPGGERIDGCGRAPDRDGDDVVHGHRGVDAAVASGSGRSGIGRRSICTGGFCGRYSSGIAATRSTTRVTHSSWRLRACRRESRQHLRASRRLPS